MSNNATTHILSVRIQGQSTDRNIHIDKSSRFRQLKDLIIENLLKHGMLPASDIIYYAIYITLSSILHDEKLKLLPHDQDLIAEFLERLDRFRLESITVSFEDIRGPNHSAATPIKAIDIQNPAAEWIQRSIPINPLYGFPISEGKSDVLFWLITSSATIQSRLTRKIGSARKELWRDYWVAYNDDKLWLFPLAVTEKLEVAELHVPLVIEVGPETILIDTIDKNIISFTYREYIKDDEMDTLPKNILMSKCVKRRETWKLKSPNEATSWVKALSRSAHDLSEAIAEENSIFHKAETLIDEQSLQESKQEMDSLAKYGNLIFFLKQSVFRNEFKKYLEMIRKLDVLTFWEYAEDFRKAYLQSSSLYQEVNKELRCLQLTGDLDIWIGKIKKLQKEMEIGSGEASMNDETQTISFDMFYPAQMKAWKFLLKLFSQFSNTQGFKQIVFRKICDNVAGVAVKDTAPTPDTASERTPVIRPILLNWLKGQLIQQPNISSNNVKNGDSNKEQLNPFWRKSPVSFAIPDWWWDRMNLEPFNEWTSVGEELLTTPSWLPTSKEVERSCSVKNVHLLDQDAVTYLYRHMLKGCDKVHLISILKCSIQFNSQLAKNRPMSLFGFAENNGTSAKFFAGEDDDSMYSSSSSKGFPNLDETRSSEMTSRSTPIKPEGNAANDANRSWTNQLVVLCESINHLHLHLLDPVSLRCNFSVKIDDVAFIGPTHKSLNVIELMSTLGEGFVLSLSCECADDMDSKMLCTQWLNTLCLLSPTTTTTVNIVKRGFLQKRGRVNTAFKWRWFELSSDLQLRYFKDDVSGIFKGSIDLSLIDPSYDSSYASYADKELTIKMDKINRTWVLKSDDEKEGGEWAYQINELINCYRSLHKFTPRRTSLGTYLDGEEEEEED